MNWRMNFRYLLVILLILSTALIFSCAALEAEGDKDGDGVDGDTVSGISVTVNCSLISSGTVYIYLMLPTEEDPPIVAGWTTAQLSGGTAQATISGSFAYGQYMLAAAMDNMGFSGFSGPIDPGVIPSGSIFGMEEITISTSNPSFTIYTFGYWAVIAVNATTSDQSAEWKELDLFLVMESPGVSGIAQYDGYDENYLDENNLILEDPSGTFQLDGSNYSLSGNAYAVVPYGGTYYLIGNIEYTDLWSSFQSIDLNPSNNFYNSVSLTGFTSVVEGAPPAPTNLQVTGTGPDSVSLSWDSVSGAYGYGIYRTIYPDADPYSEYNWTWISDVYTNSYTDWELSPGTYYYNSLSAS